jgi:transposase
MTMTPTQQTYNHVVAFEVSKETLVVHILPSGEQCTIANKPQAVRRLLKVQSKHNRKQNLGPILIVCEATGGYERHVLDVAIDLGLPVHRAHGARVRFFARYCGLVAKTDPIDARVLAQYGVKTDNLRLYVPPPPETIVLRALHARRTEIQQMMIAETCRLDQARHKSVVTSLKNHIAQLKSALEAIEDEITQLLHENASLKKKVELMRTVIGIGPVSAMVLLGYLPDIGSLTKGEVARLSGLAPINNDSGKKHGARHVEAGRTAIRRALYMAAVVAMGANPVIKTFADRLRGKGYPFKYVAVAVMRKLVVILNAVLRDGQPWRGAQPVSA